MKLKFVHNLSGDTATVLLYDSIGLDDFGAGIPGNLVAQELLYLEQTGVRKVKMRINSPGGRVIDGYSIISAMLNSSMLIDTYNDGVAASTAGMIFLAGRKRYMKDYALFMCHNPISDDENATRKDKEVLGLIKSSLNLILSNHTGINVEAVIKLMDAETWMTAEGDNSCMSMGICDEVETTGRKVTADTRNSSQLANIFNKIITSQDMKKKITSILNLDENTTDSVVETAVEKLAADKKTAEDKVKDLETQLQTAKTDLATANGEKAEAMVEAAVNSGKITEDSKASILEQAKANYAGTKAILDAIPETAKGSGKTAVKILNQGKANPAAAEGADEDEKLGWDELEKQGKLSGIRNSDPDKFKRIAIAKFGPDTTF
jgi:ATP-dependent protease ClpP protease subunit